MWGREADVGVLRVGIEEDRLGHVYTVINLSVFLYTYSYIYLYVGLYIIMYLSLFVIECHWNLSSCIVYHFT